MRDLFFRSVPSNQYSPLLTTAGLPPSVEGLSLPTHRERTGSSAGQDGSPVPVVPQVPKLRSGDKAEFMEKFRRCKPVDGMLSGLSNYLDITSPIHFLMSNR